MPHRVVITPQATKDLRKIQRFIAAKSSRRIAAGYLARIMSSLEALSIAPYQGTRREDFGPGMRTTGFEGRITILFQVKPDDVFVVGVFYGGRAVQPARETPI